MSPSPHYVRVVLFQPIQNPTSSVPRSRILLAGAMGRGRALPGFVPHSCISVCPGRNDRTGGARSGGQVPGHYRRERVASRCEEYQLPGEDRTHRRRVRTGYRKISNSRQCYRQASVPPSGQISHNHCPRCRTASEACAWSHYSEPPRTRWWPWRHRRPVPHRQNLPAQSRPADHVYRQWIRPSRIWGCTGCRHRHSWAGNRRRFCAAD